MPPRNSSARNKPVCLCTYYGCGSKSFIDEVGGTYHRGQQVSRQTYAKHWQKEEEWQARQNAEATPGSGPHSSLQDVGGVCLTTIPPKKNRQKHVNPTTSGSTPTQAARLDAPPNNQDVASRTGPILPRDPSIAQLQQNIQQLVDLIAAWIYITCGLSRAASVSLLKLIYGLVTLSIQVGYLAAQRQLRLPSTYVTTSVDPRTAISHLAIDPILRRSVHCPTCFTWYDGAAFPMLCAFRPTPKSRICATRLITEVASRNGPRKIPRQLYTTQDFKSWLEFFLSRPGIEELIQKSYTHVPNPNVMVSIWDSPAWQSIRTEDNHPFCIQVGTLTFSFYIDWFNPLLNKVAGRIVSSGAIVFYCLNLPYDIQGLPENVFVAGITPAPKEPSMTTIVHLLDPVMDQFVEMWGGAVIRTHLHPEGTLYRIGVLPGIGDMPGMRKAFGRAGVGSKRHLCSMCKIHKAQIDEIDASFPPHTSHEVSEAGRKWKNAVTQKDRKQIFDETGVRWSPLLRLTYRDSVKHTVLGVMHNWIEGIIQHHVRVLWSIGVPSGVKTTATRPRPSSHRSSQSSDSATLPDLDPILYSVTQHGFAMDIDHDDPSEGDGSNSEATLSDITDVESGEETTEQEPVDDEPPPRSTQTFTNTQLAAIRLCITDAVIPSWAARPPTNLGEASHGKLKADEWLILCTVFLPLILPELWYTQPFHSLLANFVHLVTCTNILTSHTITHEYADLYTYHYTEYRRLCLELFPDVNSRPNHHFAMHNGELMKYWGPLIKQSEFPGERLNGTLQKIPNNGRLRDMDYTMIRQICRKGRLTVFIQQQQHEYSKTSEPHTTDRKEMTAADVYRTSLNNITRNTKGPVHPKPTTDSDILPANIYNLLLKYINSQRATPLRRYDDFPHPDNASVYSYWVTPLTSFVIRNQTYSIYSKHRGNSSISFAHPSSPGVQTGFISSIWSQHIEGAQRTFFLVQPPVFLSDDDACRSPYFTQELAGLMGAVVYDTVSDACIVIEPEHVQGHVPFYRRPPGTFGINRGTIVLLNSLHRYRQ